VSLHLKSFLNFAKSGLAMFAASLALIQNEAFAVASNSISDINYKVHANNINMAPIVIMATILLVVLVAYYKVSKVEKYECFSLKCKKCGRFTRGFKCVVCQAKKSKKLG
jgi:hypothetical membrane protein